ncbi:MAG: hypothetical protein ACTS22_06600 [Phycisphaerales bacterium]
MRTRRPLCPLPAGLAALLLAGPLTGWAGATAAQTSAARAARPQPTIELAATPFELTGLGMRFQLPVGATATTRRLGSETHADVVGPDAAYRVTISSRASSNTELTSEAAANAVLLNLKEAYGISDGDAERPSRVAVATYARELRQIEPVAFAGGVAHRFYILQPATRSTPETVRGVAVIDLGQGRMLVWDATAPADEFDRLAASLDAMLSTVAFDDPAARVASRGAAIAAGTKLLEQVGSEGLQRIIENHGERWYRLHTPDETGATREVAYRRVQAELGTRDQLSAASRVSGPAGQTPGYIVRIDARTLAPGQTTDPNDRTIYDSSAAYWVSEDFQQETWRITVAIKQGRRTSTFSEVGARDGFEELVVTIQSPNGTAETNHHRIEPEGYLSMPVAALLPLVLAEAETPGDFAFYAYRSDTSSVSYRTDVFRKLEASDGWSLHTTLSPGTPALIRHLDPNGLLLREELPDGKVWEPIELRRLAELWRRQGLPID